MKITMEIAIARSRAVTVIFLICMLTAAVDAQSWKLTKKNIDSAIIVSAPQLEEDPFRPGYHLTPPAGCMGDPNGGIYVDGWYHIFYGLQPFAWHPGGWYWAHARSKDLLHWEHMPNSVTPAFDLGLDAIGSGSTIITENGKKLAFHSNSRKGPMEFWRAEFTNDSLTRWNHKGKNPVLTLDHPGLPPFDDFWRDPFVFTTEGRTFLIACADLFEDDKVSVPIFEALNKELSEWAYRGILFTVPKHKYRNLEVPELRKLGDQWIFMASTDAPVDRVNYFLGDLDLKTLTFHIKSEGIVDYSGHYYAQETIQDDEGNLFLLAWMPGWDREWLPYYNNTPIKNSNPRWNGCFAIPRILYAEDDVLFQQPVESFKKLRRDHARLNGREIPVDGPTTATQVLEKISGDQLEIQATFDLHTASFCGISLLTDEKGNGGLSIAWSGDKLNVDGVMVPMEDWKTGEKLYLQIFVDKKFVEVFVNGGKYCITRQLQEQFVKGDHVALTALGGTARLVSLEAWNIRTIN